MIKNKTIVVLVLSAVLIALIFVASWLLTLRTAHSTFENYYVFRGCIQLLEKGDDYGVCRTNSGETIKIVKYNNKWFLDGDLPWGCVGSICLGW